MTDGHPQKLQTVEAATRTIEQLNPRVNAVIHLEAQPALDPEGPTHPVLVKDCMHVRGLPTTYGSEIFCGGSAAGEDATVVDRLRRQNATIVGKANLTEFCFGATGQNDYFGNCKNPWNTDHITGGSSSGSAAAVASGAHRRESRRRKRHGAHGAGHRYRWLSQDSGSAVRYRRLTSHHRTRTQHGLSGSQHH